MGRGILIGAAACGLLGYGLSLLCEYNMTGTLDPLFENTQIELVDQMMNKYNIKDSLDAEIGANVVVGSLKVLPVLGVLGGTVGGWALEKYLE